MHTGPPSSEIARNMWQPAGTSSAGMLHSESYGRERVENLPEINVPSLIDICMASQRQDRIFFLHLWIAHWLPLAPTSSHVRLQEPDGMVQPTCVSVHSLLYMSLAANYHFHGLPFSTHHQNSMLSSLGAFGGSCKTREPPTAGMCLQMRF